MVFITILVVLLRKVVGIWQYTKRNITRYLDDIGHSCNYGRCLHAAMLLP